MSGTADFAGPEELLEHSGWILELARTLVGDPALADDLAQETWLAALRRPPRNDRPLRPWLAQVTRNLARKWRRGEGRRRHREEVVAEERETLLPSSAELAESSEALHALTGEVRALDEPFASTILLRYLRGLSAAEIARRQGVPAGTVRWRLKRGLDELRGRLDDRYSGDRTAWCRGLAALISVRAPAATTAATAATGVPWLVVATTLPVGIALLAALGLWLFGAGREAPSAPPAIAAVPRTTTEPAALDVVAPAASVGPAAAEASSRRSAEVPRPRETPPAGFAVAPDQVAVRARLVDAVGAPVSTAQLAWPEGVDAFCLSGTEGWAVLRFRPPSDRARLRLRVEKTGFATEDLVVDVAAARWTEVGEIRLTTARRISGRVVDAQGRGVEGAVVLARLLPAEDGTADRLVGPAPAERFVLEEPVTGEDGRFRLTGVPDGPVRLWAATPETLFGWNDVGDAGHLTGLEIRVEPLPRGRWIEGVVLAPSGEPVADTRVELEALDEAPSALSSPALPSSQRWRVRQRVRTDAQGRFRLVARLPGAHRLTAEDVEDRWPDAAVEPVEPGARGVLLWFAER